MDHQHLPFCITRFAGSDFNATTNLYRFVMPTGSKSVLLANSQSAALPNNGCGILQTTAGSGEACAVAVVGMSKVYAAGSFAAWAPLTTNSVGQAIVAGSGDVVLARAVSAALPGQQVDCLLGTPFRLTGAA